MSVRSTFVNRTLIVLCVAALTVISTAQADTYRFEAVDDFPIIDAGEVPYQSEAPDREALTIDAANENYRNRSARATLRYEGESDFYDITLTTLAELAGEAEYRVLINDVLVGTANNPEVGQDYTPIQHTFEDIVVPHGATVAVESLANSNGKIPEGRGTAFAGGRWTTLELDNGDAGTAAADEVDLALHATIDKSDVQVGDVFTISLDISNRDDSAVATGLQLALTRPRAEVALASESPLLCHESGNDIICPLSELPAGNTTSVSVSLQAIAGSPKARLRATITTDQQEINPDDNVVTLPLSIRANADGNERPMPGLDSPLIPDVVTSDNGQPDTESTVDERLESGQSGQIGQSEQADQAGNSIDAATTDSRSGAGSLSFWLLWLLSTPTIQCGYRRLRCWPSSASDCDKSRSAD